MMVASVTQEEKNIRNRIIMEKSGGEGGGEAGLTGR